MKSAVETLNPTRVRLTVEVPFDELKPSLDSAYRRIAQQIAIPGFRKGRVPPRLIDQRFGRGLVLEEAVNDALPQFYGQAVEQNEIQVIGHPEVDVTDVPDPSVGGDLKFTAEVDIRPVFELPAYDDVVVTVDVAEVSDDEVEEQLQGLRERFGTLSNADRPAREGDFLTLDLSGTVDGEPVEDLGAKGLSYEVGSGALLDGLDEALAGVAAGESRTFTSTVRDGEHADAQAEVTVTAVAVRERSLPELDDDFAMTASEFDTLAELRADLRSRLERSKRMQQGIDARDKVLETLLARVDVPLPESVVETEIASRQANLDAQLEGAGLSKADYLKAEGQSAEDFDADITQRTREAIKAQFVLDAIANKEELGVSQEELTDHLVRRALSSGMRPDQFAQQIVDAGQVPLLMGEVVRAKTLALILDKATVTDSAGQAVDLEALREDSPMDELDELDERDEPDDFPEGVHGSVDDDAAEPAAATTTPAETAAAEADVETPQQV